MRSTWGLLTTGLLLALAFGASAQEPDAGAPPTPDTPQDSSPATSLPAQLTVTLEPTEITVGDRVQATVTLVWMGEEPSDSPRFPTWQGTWGSAEVLATGEPEAEVDESGRRIYRQTLELTAFEVAEVQLPRVKVAVPLEDRTVDVESAEVPPFEVISVLPPEPEEAEGAAPGADPNDPAAAGEPEAPPEPKPSLPPRALPAQPIVWWTNGLLALACLLGLLAVDRRLQRGGAEAEEPPEVVLAPLEELETALVALDPALIEPSHTALSLGLRRYLGRRLAFQAVESTTSEIQRRLRETPVGSSRSATLVELLRACDQVKFARKEVGPEVTRERLRRGRDMAREIEDLLRPRPDEEAEGSEGEVTGRAA